MLRKEEMSYELDAIGAIGETIGSVTVPISLSYKQPSEDQRQTGVSASCKQLFTAQINAPRVQLTSCFSDVLEICKASKYFSK